MTCTLIRLARSLAPSPLQLVYLLAKTISVVICFYSSAVQQMQMCKGALLYLWQRYGASAVLQARSLPPTNMTLEECCLCAVFRFACRSLIWMQYWTLKPPTSAVCANLLPICECSVHFCAAVCLLKQTLRKDTRRVHWTLVDWRLLATTWPLGACSHSLLTHCSPIVCR